MMMFDPLIRGLGSVIRKGLVQCKLMEQPAFVGRFSEDRPNKDETRSGEVIIVGNSKLQKWACFPCPDGCGEMVALNLSKSRRPAWSVKNDWLGRVTVHPSIHEKAGCRSHYWVKSGAIKWCADSGGNSK